MTRSAGLAGVSGIAVAVFCSLGAHAAVISATFDQALSSAPVVISFNGVGNFLFSSATTGYGPGAAVATTGTAQVTTISGSVTDFRSDSTIDQTGELYTFASYPTAQAIPYPAADDFIGLQLSLGDGIHYGYAEVSGPSLASVGFESTPGMTIATGATGTGTGIKLTATPEPASVALLVSGLAMLCARRRRPDSSHA